MDYAKEFTAAMIERSKKQQEEIDALREQLHASEISHQHVVAEKDAEIERLKASCKHVGEANERLGTRIIEAERSAAASQLREQMYREALKDWQRCDLDEAQVDMLLSDKQDNSALEALIQKAGEVMRGRFVPYANGCYSEREFRDIPGVKLGDLEHG